MTDHKLKVHQIPTNTSQKELHHMDLQETIVLRIKRETDEAIQLLTTDPKVYKELLMHHQRGTNGSGEPLRDGVQIGSMFLELAAAGIDFRRLPQGLWNIGVFIEQRVSSGGTQGGHNPPGRACASWRPGGLSPPRDSPQAQPGPITFLLVHQNSP